MNRDQEFSFEENEEYDEIKLHRESQGDASNPSAKDQPLFSLLQTSFTLFKSFIGIGILALPHSFKLAGGGLGILGILLAGFLNYNGMKLCLKIAERKYPDKPSSYETLASDILGSWAGNSIEISIIIIQFGVAVASLIFAKNMIHWTFCQFEIFDICDSYLDIAIISFFIIAPLSFIDHMHYFYVPSLFASLFLVSGIIAQTYYNFQIIHMNGEFWTQFASRIREFHLQSSPLFFGVALYAFEAIAIMFNIRNSMKEKSRFPLLLKIEMIILTIIYGLFPLISVIAFPDDMPEIILFTLPRHQQTYLALQSLYALSALLAVPLVLLPSVKLLEKRIFSSNLILTNLIENGIFHKKYYLRIGLLLLMFMIAFLSSSFHHFLNFVGSCFFPYISFILPVMLYEKVFGKEISRGEKYVNILTSILGGTLGFLGVFVSLKELLY